MSQENRPGVHDAYRETQVEKKRRERMEEAEKFKIEMEGMASKEFFLALKRAVADYGGDVSGPMLEAEMGTEDDGMKLAEMEKEVAEYRMELVLKELAKRLQIPEGELSAGDIKI